MFFKKNLKDNKNNKDNLNKLKNHLIKNKDRDSLWNLHLVNLRLNLAGCPNGLIELIDIIKSQKLINKKDVKQCVFS